MKASIAAMVLAFAAPALGQSPDAARAEDVGPGGPAAGDANAQDKAPGEQAPPDVYAEDRRALSSEELDDLRGGEAIVIQYSAQTLTAVNAGNSVTGDTVGSGAVNLASNTFNGYDGIGNFVINTGHNNNLQGSISVSIAVTPQ
jgi:hypothetical protein